MPQFSTHFCVLVQMNRILLVLILLLSQFGYVNAQTLAGYTGLGSKAIERGNYTQALEYLNKAIDISQFNSEAFFLRGYTKYELDDYIGAEKDFGQALRLNPKNHEAYLYRGVSRSQQLKYKEAFEDFNQAIRLNDEDWRVFTNRALTSLQLDRYVDVISDCNRIIKLEKDNAQTYLLRGEAKSGLEMYRVAIEDFERAMKKDSLAMQPILRRGIARVELKMHEEAIADFNRALAMEIDNSLPIFYRGVAYAQMGKQKQALSDFNAVLDSYPENEVVLFNRAMLNSDMNREAEALSDYNKVVQLNRTNILARFNRGILHLNKNRNQLALDDFNKTLELFPEFLDAHEVRLQVLQKLGKKTDYLKAEQQFSDVKTMLSTYGDQVKEEQQIRLMKLTKLKGDFEQVAQQVGKVQHQKVDVRLLPFYSISPSPETDNDISVYDGFGRPFYNMGVITFTSNSTLMTETEALNVLLMLKDHQPKNTTEFIRAIPYYAYAKRFNDAYELLDECIHDDDKQAACYFARASVRQAELEQREKDHKALIGDLDVLDTAYENRTEQLIALIEADYRKVVELDASMSFAHFNLAHVLALAERYEEAETQFGLAASSRGNFIEANYNRGLIRLILGETAKACEDLSLAGELGMTDAYNVINRYCE